jgi:hypothetical protein
LRERGQLAFDRGLADRIAALAGQPLERDRRRQQHVVARHDGDEVACLALRRNAGIVGMDHAERQPALAHAGEVGGECRVARRAPSARLEIDEVGADRLERLEVGFAVARADQHALLRKLVARRRPVRPCHHSQPPAPTSTSSEQRGEAPAPRKCALPTHGMYAPSPAPVRP